MEWQAYFYLDDALLGNTASLEEACRTLPGTACACLCYTSPLLLPVTASMLCTMIWCSLAQPPNSCTKPL